MAVSKAQQASVNKYVKANYDRINVTIPKGRKDEIRAHAESRGQSVNGFIVAAIDEAMERDTIPSEVVFGRAVDIIAEHYKTSCWDVLDELKGLADTPPVGDVETSSKDG